jgi:uncharacterized protein YifN (PemK superfamily)
MKKILALLAVAILSLATLTACGPSAPAEKTYSFGVGSYTTVAGRDATAEVAGRVQTNVTFAAVLLDDQGKIVWVKIDTAQNQGTFTVEGKIDVAAPAATKREKGDSYGMAARSTVGEWYVQIDALEAWMIGKTPAEVAAMKLAENKPAEDDLTASVTITVDYYLGAVAKAVANAVELKGIAKVGVASYTTVAGRDATAEVAGRVQTNDTFAAVALDKDGKVMYVSIDTAQNQGTFKADGKIDVAAPAATKREKGDSYGMAARSEVGEWYVQVDSLQEWMTGKTPAEIAAMKLAENKPAEEDLTASVTITVDYYLGAVAKAVANAVVVE